MKPEDVFKWFHDELLPVAVKNGRFAENGNSTRIESCEFEAIEKNVSSFASVPSFAKLVLETDGRRTAHDLLVKFQSQDVVFREKMKTEPQFKNEVTMYNVVLPEFEVFLNSCGYKAELIREVAPKCYFAMHEEEDLDKSIVILEDLRKFGFKLTESTTELDLKHCLVAVERLAQFHAVSYAMKLKGWKALERLKNSFVHVWVTDDPITREMIETFKGLTSQRGIDYLLSKEDSEVPKEYLKNLKKLLEPIFELIINCNLPVEPLSVICHGDFNRNNLLFRYENGGVVDAKLIDFQTYLYASPCVDLAFLIYMNTTLEFREKHFDDVLNHYYSALIKTTSEILNVAEDTVAEKIPMQALRDDFGRVAIQAYITVSFFLPVMMAPSGEVFDEEMKTKSHKQLAAENYSQGGEVVSKRIAEVIVDFYRRNFYA